MIKKNWLKNILLIGSTALLVACAGKEGEVETSAKESDEAGEETILTIGATNVPHAEILEFAAEHLKEEGIILDIVRYNDYIIPNTALDEGDIDANYFQHIPFFEEKVEENDYDFVNVGNIHLEPIGAYSKRHESLDDLEENATVLVSSNVADYGRVLEVLQTGGLITVEEGVDLTTATFDDIAENPLSLQFEHEYDPALMATLLEEDEGDIVFINSNFAIDNGLSPLEDAIAIEKETSPYADIVAVRSEDAENPVILRLVEFLKSEETQEFILETWEGSVVPVTE